MCVQGSDHLRWTYQGFDSHRVGRPRPAILSPIPLSIYPIWMQKKQWQSISVNQNHTQFTEHGDFNFYSSSTPTSENSSSQSLLFFLQLPLIQQWQKSFPEEEEHHHGLDQKESPSGSGLPLLVWSRSPGARRHRRCRSSALWTQESAGSRSEHWKNCQELPTGSLSLSLMLIWFVL